MSKNFLVSEFKIRILFRDLSILRPRVSSWLWLIQVGYWWGNQDSVPKPARFRNAYLSFTKLSIFFIAIVKIFV